MKRQRLRKNLLLVMFLLFPLAYYYLSPYLIIMGASEGVITDSFMVFVIMLVSSLFLGRIFCGWICPAGGEQELCSHVRDRRFKAGKGDLVKYFIWGPWILVIIFMFYQSGGVRTIDFLYQTHNGISITNLQSAILFLAIAGVIALFAFMLGRRGFCHTACWMSPFMIIGNKIGHFLMLPSVQLKVVQDKCIHCESCSKHCPMSLDVHTMVKNGNIDHPECILCGVCIDICPEKVISYSYGKR